jgi:hypothetical protein
MRQMRSRTFRSVLISLSLMPAIAAAAGPPTAEVTESARTAVGVDLGIASAVGYGDIDPPVRRSRAARSRGRFRAVGAAALCHAEVGARRGARSLRRRRRRFRGIRQERRIILQHCVRSKTLLRGLSYPRTPPLARITGGRAGVARRRAPFGASPWRRASPEDVARPRVREIASGRGSPQAPVSPRIRASRKGAAPIKMAPDIGSTNSTRPSLGNVTYHANRPVCIWGRAPQSARRGRSIARIRPADWTTKGIMRWLRFPFAPNERCIASSLCPARRLP